ncbi:MAG TPA: hypothetical protein VFW98_07670 [Gemmatimonadaceae bacterium]|nr:hypothetical protein [Gemmatimonadaceae bacterium]
MGGSPADWPAAALPDALERYLRQQITDSDVRRVLGRWVAQAKGEGLRAEELIVRFNLLWGSLPAVQRTPMLKRRSLRERLVSACIAAYYADAK